MLVRLAEAELFVIIARSLLVGVPVGLQVPAVEKLLLWPTGIAVRVRLGRETSMQPYKVDIY